ncbi:MAG: glycosyltransferase family 9 protein [Vicinamibacteria bacterium]|nr:glycosyltransferase family 9 protein [Vicinamibacteria bacterium]
MNEDPQRLAPAPWEWTSVKRILIVRLRSIGDTVLATPALACLRRHCPAARIDLLLEDWVASLLADHPHTDRVISVARRDLMDRLRVARELNRARYDIAFNLHGGTTAALLTWATRARARVGYARYPLSWAYTHRLPSSSDFWGREDVHSVEEQLALLGGMGVPVRDHPATRLAISTAAAQRIDQRLQAAGIDARAMAILHPAAAFATKRWPVERFAAIAAHLATLNLQVVAVAGRSEAPLLAELTQTLGRPLPSFSDLSLPEAAALIARARLFVGNDSGLAHIADALGTPSVVIFGSSNPAHFGPWNRVHAESVRVPIDCSPCPGYACAAADSLACIRGVTEESVRASIARVLYSTPPCG